VPSIVSRLAVAVKRKLLLWSWHDSELVDANPELTLVTGIKTLTWIAGTRLVAGLTSSYVLVDVETQEVTDIEGPGSIGGGPGQDASRFSTGMGYMGMGGIAPKPLATRLAEGEVLLAKDVNTHFIDTDGKPLGRKQVPWAAAPEAIGYSYPFLLALQPSKGILEIRNPETLGALQSISLPHASILHVPNPYVRLAHAGKGFLVASDKCIWRMEALGYDAQITNLIENRRYDEAISLLNLLEDALLIDKEGSLRECKFLKAQGLFERRHYRPALDLFTEASAPPESVISLYPQDIAGELATEEKQPDKTDEAKEHISEPAAKEETGKKTIDVDGASLAPDKSDAVSVKSSSMQSHIELPKLEGADLKKATVELQGFLVDARTKLQRFINFDGTLKQDEDEDASEKKAQAEQLLTSHGPDDDRPYEKKLLDTAILVDTTLFRAYMLARPALAGSLFRLPNFCAPQVVREKLAANERYADLIDFFYGKNLHREALEMLQELGQSKDKTHVPEPLQGPARTVAYLQNLDAGYIDLILEFANWPVTDDPELGIEIFLADSENAETLPRHAVLEFLSKIDTALETRYLEHIIHELSDATPEFHQRLLTRYLEAAKAAKKAEDKTQKQELLEKLVALLRTSKHFEPWRFLALLPKNDSDFYEARAITLGTLGQHRQALSIYVFDMRDAAKAEEYCNQVFVTEPSAESAEASSRESASSGVESSIYTDLLSLYLSPPPPHDPQWDHGLELLAKHGPRVPATAALNLLPDVLDIANMQQYFTTRIRTAQSQRTATRFAAALRKTLDADCQATLRLDARNRNVLITEDRVCGVCHKRFGGSAIKVMPEYVHSVAS
jgi:Vam6/Vps39-like protein vacuolar protein sorting-associated protein 39